MTDRDQRLADAHSELAALPELLAELARCITERQPVEGGGKSKVTGSPAPLRLDVLHLVDDHQKPGWEGEDPRQRDLGERYGVLWTLASWTRVMAEDSDNDVELTEEPTVTTEVATINEHWQWVLEQEWVDELADDVYSLAAQIRAALGQIKLRLLCPECGNPAFIDGKWLVCTERHETSLRNLTQQQRRRPAMSTRDLSQEFHVTEAAIWQWRSRGKIQPINPGGKPALWMPWDIFRMVNPDLVDAAESYDDIPA